jgi:hypothetical protein
VTRRQRRVGRVSCSPDLKRERERPSVQLCSCFLHACQKANRQKTGPGRHTLFNTLFSAVTHTVTVRLPRLLAGHTTTVDHCVTQTTTAWSRRDVRNDVPDTAQWQSQWPRVALTSCFRCSNVRLRVAASLWLPTTTLHHSTTFLFSCPLAHHPPLPAALPPPPCSRSPSRYDTHRAPPTLRAEVTYDRTKFISTVRDTCTHQSSNSSRSPTHMTAPAILNARCSPTHMTAPAILNARCSPTHMTAPAILNARCLRAT